MALPVALQLYSIRDEVEKDFKKALENVKEMGYNGVEFAGLYGHEVNEIKDWLKEIGLEAVSAHVSLEEMLANPKKVMADYSELGCKYIAVPYLVENRRPGADDFNKTIKDMANLGMLAKQYGLQLLYHNHDFEFIKIGFRYGLDVLYDCISADLLKTEIDTCWVNVAGEDPAQYIEKYTSRAPVVHLKDFFMKEKGGKLYDLIGIEDETENEDSGDNFEFRPIGSGMQDIPSILKASENAGASWVVVEQDEPTKGSTPVECVNKSREYLKGLGW